MAVFTDSALWAGSVIESPCPSVCVYVCHKSFNRRLFFHTIEWLGLVQRIINLEGHQNLHDLLKIYDDFN